MNYCNDDRENNYVLLIILNKNMNRVLLQLKKSTEYRNRWNYPGGEIDWMLDIYPAAACYRKLSDETWIKRADMLHEFTKISVLELPHDCNTGDNHCKLYYYACIIDSDGNNDEKCGDYKEQLQWFYVNDVLKSLSYDNNFAGDGNLQYMLNIAIKHLAEEVEE